MLLEKAVPFLYNLFLSDGYVESVQWVMGSAYFMKYSEFMGRLRQAELPHLFLLAGEEHYYIEKSYQAILRKLGASKEDLQDVVQKFTGDVSLDTLIGVIETAPFFADKNIILVQDSLLFKASKSEPAGKEREKQISRLISVFEDMPPYSYVIFISGEKPDKRKKICKAVERAGAVLEAEALRAWNIDDWLRVKLHEIGKELDSEAVVYFHGAVSLMQPISLEFLDKEFDKLSMYTEGRVIAREDLKQVFASLPEISNFALLDAISGKNVSKALSLLKRQLMQGTYFTMILALLTRHVRQLWQARVLLDKGVRGKALAGPLEMNPYIAEKLGQAASKFTEDTLKEAMLKLADADYRLKTGQAGEEVLEYAIIILCCR